MLQAAISPFKWALSPLRAIGETVADVLVPDPIAMPRLPPMPKDPFAICEPASPPQKPKPADPSSSRRSSGAVARRRSSQAAAPVKAIKKVKLEPKRSLPRRRGRAKPGHYAESNLQRIAWKGTGSEHDPISL